MSPLANDSSWERLHLRTIWVTNVSTCERFELGTSPLVNDSSYCTNISTCERLQLRMSPLANVSSYERLHLRTIAVVNVSIYEQFELRMSSLAKDTSYERLHSRTVWVINISTCKWLQLRMSSLVNVSRFERFHLRTIRVTNVSTCKRFELWTSPLANDCSCEHFHLPMIAVANVSTCEWFELWTSPLVNDWFASNCSDIHESQWIPEVLLASRSLHTQHVSVVELNRSIVAFRQAKPERKTMIQKSFSLKQRVVFREDVAGRWSPLLTLPFWASPLLYFIFVHQTAAEQFMPKDLWTGSFSSIPVHDDWRCFLVLTRGHCFLVP